MEKHSFACAFQRLFFAPYSVPLWEMGSRIKVFFKIGKKVLKVSEKMYTKHCILQFSPEFNAMPKNEFLKFPGFTK